jgi:hypothetical protein
MSEAAHGSVCCPRCGKLGATADKFCAECGRFLRDGSIDQRLLLALVHEREGWEREARQELQHLLDAEPDHVLGNHQLGNLIGRLSVKQPRRTRRKRAAAQSQVHCLYRRC